MSSELKNKGAGGNPYVDKSLMENLSDFDPDGNAEFMSKHGLCDTEHKQGTPSMDTQIHSNAVEDGDSSLSVLDAVNGELRIYDTSIGFKTYRRERWFDTKHRMEFIDITSEIEEMLKESGITDGMVLVSPMHITASVIVQDNNLSLHSDFAQYLEGLVPNDESMELDLYHHNSWGDANGDSHIKRQLFKREVFISVTDGQMDFAKNERIIYSEFDGRRKKRVLIKIMGY